MALSINNASYGRDTAGKKKLVSDLQSDIDAAIKVLTGAEYNKVKTTVSNYWVGADANEFKTSLQLTANELAALFKTYKATIQKAMDTDSKQFASMQSKNASVVSSSRKAIR
jgi:hypothetical protein